MSTVVITEPDLTPNPADSAPPEPAVTSDVIALATATGAAIERTQIQAEQLSDSAADLEQARRELDASREENRTLRTEMETMRATMAPQSEPTTETDEEPTFETSVAEVEVDVPAPISDVATEAPTTRGLVYRVLFG